MRKFGPLSVILFIIVLFGCKSTNYKNQIEILQKEKEELQTKLSSLQRELMYKDTVIDNLKKQHSVKTTYPSLPTVDKLKVSKRYDIEKIYKLLKKQNFYGVTKSRKNTIVVIIARDIFQSGSDKLTPKGENEIKKLANILKLHKPRAIEIKGHTDNTGLSSASAAKFIDNFGLSSARAKNAKRVLLRYFNFDNKKISLEGLGDTKRITSNKTKSGRNINRRLEFYLYY